MHGRAASRTREAPCLTGSVVKFSYPTKLVWRSFHPGTSCVLCTLPSRDGRGNSRVTVLQFKCPDGCHSPFFLKGGRLLPFVPNATDGSGGWRLLIG